MRGARTRVSETTIKGTRALKTHGGGEGIRARPRIDGGRKRKRGRMNSSEEARIDQSRPSDRQPVVSRAST